MNAKILQESFAEIEKKSPEFTRVFYQNLFLDYPEVKKLFANTKIEQQEKKIMTVFVLTIGNLHDFAYLEKLLNNLGKRHLKYGVALEHYDFLGETLIKTLKSFLKERWNRELEAAWRQAYKMIVKLMLAGAKKEGIVEKERDIIPDTLEKIRIEAIAKKYLRKGDSINTVKNKLLEDLYFQKLVAQRGQDKTIKTISELIQKLIQEKLNNQKFRLTNTVSPK